MTAKKPCNSNAAPPAAATLPPAKRYRHRLNSLGDIKKEMGRLYREARTGSVDVQDAAKLTWCLQAIAKTIESSDLEQRITALENQR